MRDRKSFVDNVYEFNRPPKESLDLLGRKFASVLYFRGFWL